MQHGPTLGTGNMDGSSTTNAAGMAPRWARGRAFASLKLGAATVMGLVVLAGCAGPRADRRDDPPAREPSPMVRLDDSGAADEPRSSSGRPFNPAAPRRGGTALEDRDGGSGVDAFFTEDDPPAATGRAGGRESGRTAASSPTRSRPSRPGRAAAAGGLTEEEVRQSALRAAAKYSDPVAVSQLRERVIDQLTRLAGESDPQVRGNAIEAMSGIRGRVEPLVENGLRDRNEGVRAISAMVVGRSNLSELGEAVRQLENDPSPFVRSASIFAQSKLGAEVDPSPLAQLLLRNPAPRVRAQAAFILGELGNNTALPMLRRAARVQVPRALQAEVRLMELQIAEAMVKLGDEEQIETIRASLFPARPEDLEATALGAQILGQLGDRGVVQELIILTATQDEQGQKMPAEVRLAAAASLAKLGLTQGSFIGDEYVANEKPAVRAQSAFLYGEIGRPENLGKLEFLLEDQQGIVRVAAASAILKITDAYLRTGAQR